MDKKIKQKNYEETDKNDRKTNRFTTVSYTHLTLPTNSRV